MEDKRRIGIFLPSNIEKPYRHIIRVPIFPVVREGRQSDVRRTTKARKSDAQYVALAALPGVSPKNSLSNNGVGMILYSFVIPILELTFDISFTVFVLQKST